jgi:hypothetical protein
VQEKTTDYEQSIRQGRRRHRMGRSRVPTVDLILQTSESSDALNSIFEISVIGPECMVRPRVARDFVNLADAVLHQCIRPLIGACCAPGHHGYQRACELISGQASNGPFGSPVFACAGKTDPPSSSHPAPVVNQTRTYWWCSPPRTGRQRMVPASLTARETGASFSKDKCVLISL